MTGETMQFDPDALPSTDWVYRKRKEMGVVDAKGMQIRIGSKVFDLVPTKSDYYTVLSTTYKKELNEKFQDRVREMAMYVASLRTTFENKMKTNTELPSLFITEEMVKQGWNQSRTVTAEEARISRRDSYRNKQLYVYVPKEWVVDRIAFAVGNWADNDRPQFMYRLKKPTKPIKVLIRYLLQYDQATKKWAYCGSMMLGTNYEKYPFQFHGGGNDICTGEASLSEELNAKINEHGGDIVAALDELSDRLMDIMGIINMDSLSVEHETHEDGNEIEALLNFVEEAKTIKAPTNDVNSTDVQKTRAWAAYKRKMATIGKPIKNDIDEDAEEFVVDDINDIKPATPEQPTEGGLASLFG